METFNIHEAKTHLSRIIARVIQGESVIIGKAGEPVAVLSPYSGTTKTRKPGSLKGKIQIAEDFDAVDPVVVEMFEARDEQP